MNIPDIGGSLRDEILKAARQLMVEDGVKNLSMRKIASKIGCKAPSIYYHFKNKDAIIHSLIDEGHEILKTYLQKAEDTYSHPAERLEGNWRAFIQFGMDHPEFYEIMYMTHLDGIDRYPKENYRRTRLCLNFSIKILEDCHAQGLIEKEDFTMLTSSVAIMLHGYVSMALTHRLDSRLGSEPLRESIIASLLKRLGLHKFQQV